jgi:hypothetical protein
MSSSSSLLARRSASSVFDLSLQEQRALEKVLEARAGFARHRVLTSEKKSRREKFEDGATVMGDKKEMYISEKQ